MEWAWGERGVFAFYFLSLGVVDVVVVIVLVCTDTM